MSGPVLAEDPAAARAGALLSIDLAAIRSNYRRVQQELGSVECAAVVKADAYGLGLGRVGPTLAQAGARQFFVALLDEGLALRQAFRDSAPEATSGSSIAVLNGVLPGSEGELSAEGLIPVLNSLGEVDRWRDLAHGQDRRLPAILHVDSGMCRLGLPPQELAQLAADPSRLDGLDLRLVMSHLACAEDHGDPMNRDQLTSFRETLRHLPPAAASLANSAGIFLGSAFHFDLVRPGVALYGVNPLPGSPNPMSQVVHLQGKILQVRDVDAPQSVGYGADHRVEGPARIATVAVGYADGYLRSLSNRGSAYIGGQRVSLVGRVSMDMITLDVTSVAQDLAIPGALVDLIGPDNDLDALADQANTIGYELLTSLGRRYHRIYTDS